MPVFPRIREIHIRNYKSIPQAVVRLSDLTVLVGANGSGKSNFVDALAFASECLASSVDVAVRRRGGRRGLSWRFGSATEPVGLRFILDLTADSTADYTFELVPADGTYRVSGERCIVSDASGETHMFGVRGGAFQVPIPGIRARVEPDRLALYAASATPEFRSVYDFLSDVRSYQIQPELVGEIQDPAPGLELWPDGGNSAWVLRYLRTSNRDRFERISELIASVVPGVQGVNTTNLMGESEIIRFDEHRPDGSGAPAFSGYMMSSGTLRMLGLLLAAYQPTSPAVLIIEEPEANIHPAAAEVITSVLLDVSRRSQVVITTHSPEVVDYKDLPDDAFRVVSKIAGQTTIAPLAESSRAAIREHLYSPGELLRSDELNADLAAADELSRKTDLFGPPAERIVEAA